MVISIASYAQFYSKPKEPTFDYMTNLTSGHPTLYWTAPSHNSQYPNPTGYIIYKKMPDPLGNEDYFAIDTVSSTTFSYTDSSSSGNQKRLFYRIASRGPTEPSRQTLHHANIWLTAEYDSCNAVLKLNWESYSGWKNENIEKIYNLYYSSSPDLTSFTLLDTVGKFDNKYFVKNIKENSHYYFYLSASRKDTALTTLSNLFHKRTTMPLNPQYITIDTVIASNNGSTIYYNIDSTTELSNFRLVRWEYPDTNKILFSAKVIESFSDPQKSVSIDSTDTWAARTRKFYYKIDALNGCRTVVKVSNLCNTIIPVAKPQSSTIDLEWDMLHIDTARCPGRIHDYVSYKIYRIVFLKGTNITENGEVIEVANISSNKFTDNIAGYQYQNPPYKFTFKYIIEATEHSPSGEVVALSRSRTIVTEVIPGVTMPNAIAPKMANYAFGHSRNIFEPVISFDATYSLTIYDRWGGLIYHGNQGWNGQYTNGNFAREGTYAYRLEIFTEDSGSVIKIGHFSVVYP